jgi:acyl-coenzyme A synthetase/AMP-(fatty) acid ligase
VEKPVKFKQKSITDTLRNIKYNVEIITPAFAKAFIILKPEQSLTSDSLIEWSKENMANYKVPREIDFIDDLPTNAAGKIMKYLLREKP